MSRLKITHDPKAITSRALIALSIIGVFIATVLVLIRAS